jgi:hypothetical protein
MLHGPQRGFQRHDRAGPLGGQRLGNLSAGALQLQGVLERLDTVFVGPGTGRVRCCLLLRMPGWCRLLPVQAGLDDVVGGDLPLPGLTGNSARGLAGAGEASVAQVATDRRGRQAAHLGGLGNAQGPRLLGVVTAMRLGGRITVAHLRSLSRPAVRQLAQITLSFSSSSVYQPLRGLLLLVKEVSPMTLWGQLAGQTRARSREMNGRLGILARTTWQHLNRHAGRSPSHTTPYLDVILPPCAAICFMISMYAVLGIGLDWQSGNWRGDLLILLLAVGLPLVLAALRHWLRWRA